MRKSLPRVFALASVLAVLAAPVAWKFMLKDYQRSRISTFFDPEQDAKGAGYQQIQARITVGSGGLSGKGFKHGTQGQLRFLPVAHNDFIFSVIAEEKGFVGSVIVLTLYGAILFTGIRIAGQARDRLGRLLAVGVVTLLFSHVFINISMNIRIMPVTGVPLPLLSYGGSSVLGSLIAIGLLQNVYIYRKAY